MLSEHLHEDRIEEALAYMVETDALYAKLKAEVERTKHRAKRVEALEVMCAEGSAQVRKAVSEAAPASVEAWNQHFDAIEAFEKLRAERDSLEMRLEVWKCWQSGRKQGARIS